MPNLKNSSDQAGGLRPQLLPFAALCAVTFGLAAAIYYFHPKVMTPIETDIATGAPGAGLLLILVLLWDNDKKRQR